MTKAQVTAAIKALPGRCMTVRCVDGEYRVSFAIPAIQMANDYTYNEAKERNEAVAYYTDDAEDAIGTAKAMNARYIETARI